MPSAVGSVTFYILRIKDLEKFNNLPKVKQLVYGRVRLELGFSPVYFPIYT